MSTFTAAALTSSLAFQVPATPRESTLSPLAQEHQDKGDQAMDRGEYGVAHWNYVRAYDLSRPNADQEARETLRIHIDQALRRLFAARGDVNYLCQSWDFHERHIRALQREGSADAAGSLVTAVEGLKTEVARVSGRPAERTCAARASARPLTLAGGLVTGLGASSVGVAIYALAVNVADYRRLEALKAAFPEGPQSVLELELATDLMARGNSYRRLAIAAGVVGVLVTTVGLALLGRARQVRPARPRLRASALGVGLHF